ncbi:uncharacterized protein LDX57_010497 [Aspergillus melleus]|uniref:uncharacterized protein n=1 Tax=Aspergillus melleus TaxID=138277 RepID=UPI001E8D047E|nr:uncharacterized protein LDX57_010497 [Aspergillus melleus]KAH8432867.1 hypothetical protein LDX57_010497 [Aspergillus melleus]
MLSGSIILLVRGLSIIGSLAHPSNLRRDDTPRMPHDPNTTPYCTWWIDNDGSMACTDVPPYWAISMEDFVRWNPSLSLNCQGFETGKSYCVEALGEPKPSSGPTTLTSTSTKGPTTTNTAPPSTTVTTTDRAPGPTQTGQAPNCNRWDLVKGGDTCSVFIEKYTGLTLANLIEWNPAIGSQCESLWVDTYLCTSVIGWVPTPPTTTTTTGPTKSPNGISTPTPIQPGMIPDCNGFYKVKSGDGCAAIAKANGISLVQFMEWNPTIGSYCSSLWLDYYVCVSRIGVTTTQATTTTETTTKPTNGIATPTPTHPGMVDNCNAFYKVKSGDGCAAIAQTHGISLSQFYAWNPSVGKGCEALWSDYYVCVCIVGVSPTTTTKAVTSTRSGNGVATPTPIQPGMTTSCKKFYQVVSGDECGKIASKAGITLQDFLKWNPGVGGGCESLWLGYYVCIAVL